MQVLSSGLAASVSDRRYLATLRTHWKTNKGFPSLPSSLTSWL